MAMNYSTIYDLRKNYQYEMLSFFPNSSVLERCEISNSSLRDILEMADMWEDWIKLPETNITARDNAQVSLSMTMLVDTYDHYLGLFCYDEEDEQYDADEYDEEQYDALGSH